MAEDINAVKLASDGDIKRRDKPQVRARGGASARPGRAPLRQRYPYYTGIGTGA